MVLEKALTSDVWERRMPLLLGAVLVASIGLRIHIYRALGHSDFYQPAIAVLGQGGEGFLRGKPFQYDHARQQRIAALQTEQGRLIDPADVPRLSGEPEAWAFDTKREPGYSMLLGLLWKIGPAGRYGAVMLLQNLIGIVLAFLLFFELRGVVPPWAALGSFAAFMLFPPPLRYESLAYTYCWLGFSAAAALAVLARVQRTGRAGLGEAVAFGAFVGVCYWIRSVVFPLVFITGAGAWYLKGRRAGLALLAGALIGFGAVLAPMPWVSMKIYKTWKPARLTFWHTVWVGFGQVKDNPFGAEWSDAKTQEMVRREVPGIVTWTVEYEAHLKKKSIAAIRSRPSFLITLAIERVKRMTWSSWEPFNSIVFKALGKGVALWTLLWGVVPFLLRGDGDAARLARAVLPVPYFILAMHGALAVEFYYVWPAHAPALVGFFLTAAAVFPKKA